MSYLSEYTKRFFFLVGKTDDEFITGRLEILTAEEVLFSHLKELGYERIVFYNGRQKIYYMDMASKHKSQINSVAAAAPGEPAPRNNRLQNLRSPVGKKVLPSSPPLSPSIVVEHVTERLHLGSMQDVEVVGLLDHVMKDSAVKTAVVFSRGIDFIDHLDSAAVRMMAGNMTDWSILGASNENICVFVFPDLHLESLRSKLQGSAWEFFLPLLFESENKLTSQTISIGAPSEDEITSLLHYYRVIHQVDIDWLQFKSICQTMTRAVRSGSRRLKEVNAQLRQRKIRRFDLSFCHQLFGTADEEPAINRLRQMKGMESVCQKVERLVQTQQEMETKETKTAAAASGGVSSVPLRLLPGMKQQQDSNKNLHIALKGNPGTGKTTVAQLIGQIYRDAGLLPIGHTVTVTRKDLVGGYIGQTAIRTAEKIADAIGGVLFIDEAYQLSEGGDNDFGKEAIETVMEAMSSRRGEFAVIIAGYPEKIDHFIQINPGLTRRFGPSNIISIDDYTPEVLQFIFEQKLAKEGQSISVAFQELLPDFFRNWYSGRDPQHFGNAGDVETLLLEMKENRTMRAFGSTEFTPEDIPESKKKYWHKRKAATVEESLALLDDLTGLQHVKQWLKALTSRIQMQQRRQERGMQTETIVPGHYLFVGNPGTGKTTVAKRFGEILNQLNLIGRADPIIATPDDFISSRVGEPEKKMKEFIARSTNGILFIDEAHELHNKAPGAFKALVQPLVEHADSLCVILAGYPEPIQALLSLDPGMKRRFQDPVLFEDYTDEELYTILESAVTARGESMTADLMVDLRRLFSVWIAEKKQDFGNAGDVHKLLDQMRANRDNRLASSWSDALQDDELLLFLSDDIPDQERTRIGHRPQTLQDIMRSFNDLTGLNQVKKHIQSMINRIQMEQIRGVDNSFAPGHYIFAGNPGTGKTTVAGKMGQIFQSLGLLMTSRVVEVKRAELVAGYQGQTAGKTRERLMEALDGVLFIDEAYQLYNGPHDSFGIEAINEIIDFMEKYRHRLCIIAAGYNTNMKAFLASNPGLASRFQLLYFEDYNLEELYEIFLRMVHQRNYELGQGVAARVKDIFASGLAMKDEHFGNARSVRNYFGAMENKLNNRLAHLISVEGLEHVKERDPRVLYLINNEDLPDTLT